MLDLQTYVLYELFVSRQQETSDQRVQDRRASHSAGNPLLARVLTALGDGLVISGRKLKQRYEPVAGRRVQTQH